MMTPARRPMKMPARSERGSIRDRVAQVYDCTLSCCLHEFVLYISCRIPDSHYNVSVALLGATFASGGAAWKIPHVSLLIFL